MHHFSNFLHVQLLIECKCWIGMSRAGFLKRWHVFLVIH